MKTVTGIGGDSAGEGGRLLVWRPGTPKERVDIFRWRFPAQLRRLLSRFDSAATASALAVIAIFAAAHAMTATAADTIPPSRPLQLTLTNKTASSITLIWSISTDNTAVVAYDVFRDGDLAGIVTSNLFVCPGLEQDRAYTFRVRARDAAGNRSDDSNALLATPQEGTPLIQPVVVRTQFNALVLHYDPYVCVNGNYMRAADYEGFRDVDALISQYIELYRRASGGQMIWSVTNHFDLNEFAPPLELSQQPLYDATNYVALRSQGYGYAGSCLTLIHDPRFGIADKVNAGEIDAVWVFAPPAVGFAETAMAGPSPYWINGAAIWDPSLNRNLVFYGFGIESHQGPGFMCENTCHMTENIINNRIAPAWPKVVPTRVFNTLNLNNPARTLTNVLVNDWIHFVQAEAANWDAMLVAPGASQAGLSHFPATAVYNYDWSTVLFDFGGIGPFHIYDGTWSVDDGELHVLSGNGVKVLAFDDVGMSDDTGAFNPAMAFSDGDIELQVRVMNGAANSHAGFIFRVSRCQAGANQVTGYYAGLNAYGDQVVLAKLQNAFVTLSNASCVVNTNVPHQLRVEARRSQIKVYLDGALTPVIAVTDTNYITGGFGLAAYSTEAFFDNLSIVAHTWSTADKWYDYPATNAPARDLSPLEWSGDAGTPMEGFYAWWWEHFPKNGGGHYVTNLQSGAATLVLNNWWPYVFDHNRFASSSPFPDVVFPPEDVTAPAPPESVTGVALGKSQVRLSWTEPADNVGVTRYTVFRDGVFLRKTALPYLHDLRLSPDTRYTYEIQACDGSGNTSEGVSVSVTTLPAASAAVIYNGDFEFDPQITDWSPGAFIPSLAQFSWEPPGTGRNGSRCVSITASDLNDAWWGQTITGLQPGETYWITGWIKGENINIGAGGDTGANLCQVGTWDHGPGALAGTFDWRPASFSFTAPSSGNVDVGCRLGYWSSVASGKVWFDDLAIVKPVGVRLDHPQILAGGQFQFLLIANPGHLYRIEKSSNLKSWSPVQTFLPDHPITEIRDNVIPGSTCFYRAVQTDAEP